MEVKHRGGEAGPDPFQVDRFVEPGQMEPGQSVYAYADPPMLRDSALPVQAAPFMCPAVCLSHPAGSA